MIKAEFIKRHGLEWYEQYKVRRNAYKKARYVENGRIDLIENYELALADNFKGWQIHHRLEIRDDYINSIKHLKLMNLYYNRPPEELIWLRHSEHVRIHFKDKKLSEETKRKMSTSRKGKCKHNKGKPRSEFGRKFFDKFGYVNLDNLYYKEKCYYYRHGKCRWEE